MGAWGLGHFDNDDAQDWFATWEASGFPLAGVTAAIQPILDKKDDYIEAPEASIAVAAIAALAGGLSSNAALSKDIPVTFSASQADLDAVAKNAKAAIDIIVNNSELKDLWEESEALNNWRTLVFALKKNL